MKPASIIFLIVSVVLIICGVVLFQVGASIAKNEGEEIFTQQRNEDSDYVYAYKITDTSDSDVRRISINLNKKTDIYIHGGAEENRIELINFTEESFNLANVNQALTIDDETDILKLFEWGKNGFNFDGLRNYFRRSPFEGGPKRINIYLTDYNNIKLYEINLANGNIFVESVKSSGDCFIIIDNGDLTIDGYVSPSDFSLEIGEGKADLRNAYSRNVTITIGKGELFSQVFGASILYRAEVGSGNIGFTLSSRGSDFEANLKAEADNGKITAFGEDSGKEFGMEHTDDDVLYEIITGDGDIVIG